MRLIFVRHGETGWNAERRYQGHQPIPLNERGRWQAHCAGRRLAATGAVALYASDIARAWETATIIGTATGLEPQAAPLLREIDDGLWAGHTPEELEARYPEHMAQMRQAPDVTIRLEGESYTQLQTRMIANFEHLAQRHQHETIIAVSHGGAIRALICHLLHIPLALFGRLWIENGAFAEIIPHGDAWRILHVNDTSHLSGGFASGE